MSGELKELLQAKHDTEDRIGTAELPEMLDAIEALEKAANMGRLLDRIRELEAEAGRLREKLDIEESVAGERADEIERLRWKEARDA